MFGAASTLCLAVLMVSDDLTIRLKRRCAFGFGLIVLILSQIDPKGMKRYGHSSYYGAAGSSYYTASAQSSIIVTNSGLIRGLLRYEIHSCSSFGLFRALWIT